MTKWQKSRRSNTRKGRYSFEHKGRSLTLRRFETKISGYLCNPSRFQIWGEACRNNSGGSARFGNPRFLLRIANRKKIEPETTIYLFDNATGAFPEQGLVVWVSFENQSGRIKDVESAIAANWAKLRTDEISSPWTAQLCIHRVWHTHFFRRLASHAFGGTESVSR